jgi:hypothetical protein
MIYLRNVRSRVLINAVKKLSITAAAVFALCLNAFAATDAAVRKNLRLVQEGDATGQFQLCMAYDSGTGVFPFFIL